MKKILTLALPLLLTILSAKANVIWQEQFIYTNGPITQTGTNTVGGVQVTNWIKFSGTATNAGVPGDMYVNNHRLEVSTTGGSFVPSRQDDVGRPFTFTPGSPYTNAQQMIYLSFIINFTNITAMPVAGSSTYLGMFKTGSYTGTSYQGKVFACAGSLTNTFRLGVSITANTPNTTFALDLTTNTDYQVVLQWDPVNLYALSLWINPISSSDTKISSVDTFVPAGNNIADMWAFRQAASFNGFFTVSNLVLATTFDEAATNVWATNAVMPTIVYQPQAITTNFINSTASLSALANGQGQASLIYQWQVSSSPANTSPADVSNPNGNSNVLSVDSSVLGNFYYTMIATTPWGLSVTSSVAKVAIVPAVGPPSFVSQPVSQTTFSGATVILTTSVLSPGNITYTWFSNNVVVTAGQQNSGLSSSLTIAPATTTATYKVAVTNDTTTVGILSTNAIVTVNPIQAVSIAYVRSLIDPVTFVATNTTTPYSITGTIICFTNITFGNTASYYLWDGTAGINIFATFGSTFRPMQGDNVTFVGVTSSFSSGFELAADLNNKTYTGGVINSHGNPLPAPTVIPFNFTNTTPAVYLATNLAGSLVTLQNVYFGTNTGRIIGTSANTLATVTNASGIQAFLTFYEVDGDYTNKALPSFASSVTGILIGSPTNSNYGLGVTKWSDVVQVVVAPPLTVSQSGNLLTFSWTDGSYNMQSQTNTLGVGLSTNSASWFNYPDPSNPLNVTIDPTAPTVFFRLTKP